MKDYDFYTKKYSEEYLRNYIKEEKPSPAFWFYISCHQDLSEAFIDEFHNQLVWESICKYQKLSIDLCNRYLKKINWYNLCRYGYVFEELMIEFVEYMDLYLLKYNDNINAEVFRRIKNLKKVIDQ